MTEEQNELKKKILIGLGIFLLFFIPSLIAIINKFNYKESNILNRISKEESFLIVVKDKDTEMTKNIESYLKNNNYVYEDLDSTDEVRYKKVLYKLDISSDDIEEPTIIYVSEGKIYSSLVNVEDMENFEKKMQDEIDDLHRSNNKNLIAKGLAKLHDWAKRLNEKYKETKVSGPKTAIKKALSWITGAIASLTRRLHNLTTKKENAIND